MIYPNPKKIAGVIVKGMEMKNEEELDPNMDSLKFIAEDILAAVNDKSPHDLMVALRSFFESCDAMPHVEGEHES